MLIHFRLQLVAVAWCPISLVQISVDGTDTLQVVFCIHVFDLDGFSFVNDLYLISVGVNDPYFRDPNSHCSADPLCRRTAQLVSLILASSTPTASVC